MHPSTGDFQSWVGESKKKKLSCPTVLLWWAHMQHSSNFQCDFVLQQLYPDLQQIFPMRTLVLLVVVRVGGEMLGAGDYFCLLRFSLAQPYPQALPCLHSSMVEVVPDRALAQSQSQASNKASDYVLSPGLCCPNPVPGGGEFGRGEFRGENFAVKKSGEIFPPAKFSPRGIQDSSQCASRVNTVH